MSVPLIKTPTVAEDTTCLNCRETAEEKNSAWFAHPDVLKPVELVHHVCLRCLKNLAGRNLSRCITCREPYTAFPTEAYSTSLQERVGMFISHHSEGLAGLFSIAGTFAGLFSLEGILEGTALGPSLVSINKEIMLGVDKLTNGRTLSIGTVLGAAIMFIWISTAQWIRSVHRDSLQLIYLTTLGGLCGGILNVGFEHPILIPTIATALALLKVTYVIEKKLEPVVHSFGTYLTERDE